MTSHGPGDLNDEFVRSLPDAGPVVMVNLVRFRAQSRENAIEDHVVLAANESYSKFAPGV